MMSVNVKCCADLKVIGVKDYVIGKEWYVIDDTSEKAKNR